MERGGIFRIHEYRVTLGSREWIDFVIDQAVELFAAPGADFKRSRRAIEVRQRHGAEVGFAVGRWEFPIGAEMRTAVLKGVTGLVQMLEAIVEGDDPGDLLAHGRAGLAAEELGAVRVGRRGELAQDFPLGFRFTDLAWNLRTENDAPFGAGFVAPILLLL